MSTHIWKGLILWEETDRSATLCEEDDRMLHMPAESADVANDHEAIADVTALASKYRSRSIGRHLARPGRLRVFSSPRFTRC